MLQIARFGADPAIQRFESQNRKITSDFEGLGTLRFAAKKGFKSQIGGRFELRFEVKFLTAIWGIFLRFGLRDLKSLARGCAWVHLEH